jgi:hypothetical protein
MNDNMVATMRRRMVLQMSWSCKLDALRAAVTTAPEWAQRLFVRSARCGLEPSK